MARTWNLRDGGGRDTGNKLLHVFSLFLLLLSFILLFYFHFCYFFISIHYFFAGKP